MGDKITLRRSCEYSLSWHSLRTSGQWVFILLCFVNIATDLELYQNIVASHLWRVFANSMARGQCNGTGKRGKEPPTGGLHKDPPGFCSTESVLTNAIARYSINQTTWNYTTKLYNTGWGRHSTLYYYQTWASLRLQSQSEAKALTGPRSWSQSRSFAFFKSWSWSRIRAQVFGSY